MTTEIETTQSEQTALVTVTPKAAARARELLTQKGMPEGALRVFVVGGGCSGYQYGMSIAEQADAEDTIITAEGLRILIDPDSATLIGGAEVDYVDLMKSGFTIYNPNATSSCACGSSFQSKDGSGQARACH